MCDLYGYIFFLFPVAMCGLLKKHTSNKRKTLLLILVNFFKFCFFFFWLNRSLCHPVHIWSDSAHIFFFYFLCVCVFFRNFVIVLSIYFGYQPTTMYTFDYFFVKKNNKQTKCCVNWVDEKYVLPTNAAHIW